jgi:hypothetical protein
MPRLPLLHLAGRTLLPAVLAIPAFASDPPGSENNWHQWRGPSSTGQAAPSARPPLQWSETQNVAWKLDLPGEGSSTPIIWDDQVFVLSAVATDRPAETPITPHPDAKTLPPNVYHRYVVTAVDRTTGQVRWQKTAAEELPHEGKHNTHTYAAASPVTDGHRLYASFGSRGIHCYSLDGNLLWSKDLGDMRTRFAWGEAVTPALAGDLLIVNWDQEENSFIVALQAETGEEVWRRDRPGEKTSWNTPLITEVNGRSVAVVNGSGKARPTMSKPAMCSGNVADRPPTPSPHLCGFKTSPSASAVIVEQPRSPFRSMPPATLPVPKRSAGATPRARRMCRHRPPATTACTSPVDSAISSPCSTSPPENRSAKKSA